MLEQSRESLNAWNDSLDEPEVHCTECGTAEHEDHRPECPFVRLRLPDPTEVLDYEYQPYTYGAKINGLRVSGVYAGNPVITAYYVKATQRAYLFGQQSERTLTGGQVTIYGVTQRELDTRRIVRVAS